MKKYTKVLALALALTLLLSMNVFAADVGYTVTATGGSGAEATDATAENFDLTAPAETGKMYLLLVLDASKDQGIPTASNILYVNQATASGSAVFFDNVYPSKIVDSNIYLAGGPALTQIALLDAADPEYPFGDINKDKRVNIQDVIRLLNHVNKSNKLADTTGCDINSDTRVNIQDVIRLLNHVNKSDKLY